jgi:hypothetical protein
MTETNLRQRVLEAIPGYTEAITRNENGRVQMRSLREGLRFEQAYAEMRDQIIALLDAGDPVPVDIGKDVAQAELDDRALTLRAQVIAQVTPNTRDFRNDLLNTGADAGCAALSRELATLVEQVKEIAPHLTGITTATQAINAGGKAVDAWRRVTGVVSDYDEIRKLQQEIYTASLTHIGSEDAYKVSLVAESMDVVPYWVNRRKDSASVSKASTPAAMAYRKWMLTANAAWVATDNASWWPTQDQEQHLFHIAMNLTPWVPTPSEIEELLRLAGRATASVDQDSTFAKEKARQDYYDIAGYNPGIDITSTPTDASDNTTARRALNRALDQHIAINNTWAPTTSTPIE